ncbi:helix-turn-helix transcriptional regulator [Leptobacterium sp. I13]|uniref:helix-turn-helix domain-containing protein n=1 Tax=Leptobacterium meishanense TaxID=3128904 RepID=UPI0030EF3A9D
MDVNSLTIKKYREENGLTQMQLAEKLGVSFRTVQNYESGHPIPKSKLVLFRSLFKNGHMDHHKDTSEIDQKFKGISFDEIAMYCMAHDEELMKNKTFSTYIENKTVKAIKGYMERLIQSKDV